MIDSISSDIRGTICFGPVLYSLHPYARESNSAENSGGSLFFCLLPRRRGQFRRRRDISIYAALLFSCCFPQSNMLTVFFCELGSDTCSLKAASFFQERANRLIESFQRLLNATGKRTLVIPRTAPSKTKIQYSCSLLQSSCSIQISTD